MLTPALRTTCWTREARQRFAGFPGHVVARGLDAIGVVACRVVPDILNDASSLGDGVWELSIHKSGTIWRFLYILQLEETLWVLHASQRRSANRSMAVESELRFIRPIIDQIHPITGCCARNDFGFECGSNNVFADFGTAEPNVRLLRARLVGEIIKTLDREGLSVWNAGARVGAKGADFSRIRQVKLKQMTVDRLLHFNRMLKGDADITSSVPTDLQILQNGVERNGLASDGAPEDVEHRA